MGMEMVKIVPHLFRIRIFPGGMGEAISHTFRQDSGAVGQHMVAETSYLFPPANWLT
jgi:hypothetical protein